MRFKLENQGPINYYIALKNLFIGFLHGGIHFLFQDSIFLADATGNVSYIL